jgi:hypothetical protein
MGCFATQQVTKVGDEYREKLRIVACGVSQLIVRVNDLQMLGCRRQSVRIDLLIRLAEVSKAKPATFLPGSPDFQIIEEKLFGWFQ